MSTTDYLLRPLSDESAIPPRLMDAVYLADPLRDRVKPFAHLQPSSLFFVVVKNSAIQALLLLADTKTPPIPPERNDALKFFASRVWKPCLKDVSITSLTRYFEHKIISSPTNSLTYSGRYIRNVSSAAKEANAVAVRKYEHTGKLSDAFSGRVNVALHVATEVIPKSTFLNTLAVCIVEQVDLVGTYLYHLFRKGRAESTLQNPQSDPRSIYAARHTIQEAEAAITKVNLQKSSGLNVVRGIVTIWSEVVFGGFGTLLDPGIGTFIGKLIGNTFAFICI